MTSSNTPTSQVVRYKSEQENDKKECMLASGDAVHSAVLLDFFGFLTELKPRYPSFDDIVNGNVYDRVWSSRVAMVDIELVRAGRRRNLMKSCPAGQRSKPVKYTDIRKIWDNEDDHTALTWKGWAPGYYVSDTYKDSNGVVIFTNNENFVYLSAVRLRTILHLLDIKPSHFEQMSFYEPPKGKEAPILIKRCGDKVAKLMAMQDGPALLYGEYPSASERRTC